MAVLNLPLIDVIDLQPSLTPQVKRLVGLGADTTFHQYVSHAPHIVDFFWRDFYSNIFYDGLLPLQTKEVVRLALAALSGCSFCRVGDIDSALQNGLSKEQVDGVLALDPTTLAANDKAAFSFALKVSPFSLSDELLSDDDWAELRTHFSDAQMSELLICTSVMAGVGRMLVVAGFVPRTCEVPLPQVLA